MKTFEELPVWQDGRELVKEIYALTRMPGFRNDSGLCDQIQRAVVSICSNIAEGHERGSAPDLIQYLFFAKGSAGEVRSQLYHAEDFAYAGRGEAKRLREMARGISRPAFHMDSEHAEPVVQGRPEVSQGAGRGA